MNYSVHSVMYFYYFMANIGYFKLVRPFAIIITFGQIAQMVGGLTVLLNARKIAGEGRFCDNDAANIRLGLAMYFSYFVLFCILFNEKYVVFERYTFLTNSSVKREDFSSITHFAHSQTSTLGQ